MVWLGAAGLGLWLKGSNRKIRKQGFVIGLILIILSILPLMLGFSAAASRANSGRAVLMVGEASLKSAADELSEDILILHEGTSMILLDQIGPWKKIQLSNGEEGWLEAKFLEEI